MQLWRIYTKKIQHEDAKVKLFSKMTMSDSENSFPWVGI